MLFTDKGRTAMLDHTRGSPVPKAQPHPFWRQAAAAAQPGAAAQKAMEGKATTAAPATPQPLLLAPHEVRSTYRTY